jgi:aminopeptidase YwaD
MILRFAGGAAALLTFVVSAVAVPQTAKPPAPICAECVRAHMQKLAGDELRGRGCGTEDEHTASLYLQAELEKAGIAPAYAGGLRQAVGLETPRLDAPPALEAKWSGGSMRLAGDDDFLFLGGPSPARGRLVRLETADFSADVKGAIVFYDRPGRDRAGIQKLQKAGAAAVLFPADAALSARWAQLAASAHPRTRVADAENEPAGAPVLILTSKGAQALRRAPGGASIDLDVRFGAPERTQTYNVVGVIHGTDPDADRKALLLSAHYDHLGVRDGVIYHGADDDASGTSAVLEFARILGSGPRPRRTVYFALFGCEEAGGLGAIYFRAHPPTTLSDLAMNIEFEMIGNDDPKRPGVLMLTGWERSNLGPTLAAHGAHVGPDLYPEQNFFQRSDNYELALKGVVAQTVSAWPIPPTYHDPSDTLDHIDFAFMDQAIGSMIGPVQWLVDSDFKPEWKPGMKP